MENVALEMKDIRMKVFFVCEIEVSSRCVHSSDSSFRQAYYKAVRSLYTTMASGGRNSALSGLPVSPAPPADDDTAGDAAEVEAMATGEGCAQGSKVLGTTAAAEAALLPLLLTGLAATADADAGNSSGPPPLPTP